MVIDSRAFESYWRYVTAKKEAEQKQNESK